ncbi:hypothetical protein VFDL14_15790 [Vibrio fortis]|uniref:Uncharacterized protein n=1 Tax=Vibrio fortis TaxID=212667 RepID=A0A066UMS2_9VIBR|nr:hypothetical protein VFDL14_15790 [Vibrio fortis]
MKADTRFEWRDEKRLKADEENKMRDTSNRDAKRIRADDEKEEMRDTSERDAKRLKSDERE